MTNRILLSRTSKVKATKKRYAFRDILLTLFLVFPFFCPVYFLAISETFKLIIYYLRIVAFILIVLQLAKTNSKLNAVCIIGICMQIWVLLITFLKNRVEFNAYLAQIISGISMFLIVPAFNRKKDLLVDGLLLLFEINIYLNLFFMFFNILPHYDGYQHFLGTENSLVLFFLPGLLLSLIHFYRSHNLLRFVFFLSALIVSILMIWVATTMVAVFGSLVILLLLYGRKKPIKVFYLWLLTFVFSFSLIFFSDTLVNTTFFQWFTTELLKKDVTMSDRFSVWSIAITMIKNSPFTGYGYNALLYGVYGFNSHAHNFYLELLIVGGIVYFILFMAVIFASIRAIDKHSNKKLAIVFGSVLFAVFITFITEAYSEIWRLFIIFSLSVSIRELDHNSLNNSCLLEKVR